MNGANQPPSWGLMPDPNNGFDDLVNSWGVSYFQENNITLPPSNNIGRAPTSDRTPSPQVQPSTIFIGGLRTPYRQLPSPRQQALPAPAPQRELNPPFLTDAEIFAREVERAGNPALSYNLPDYSHSPSPWADMHTPFVSEQDERYPTGGTAPNTTDMSPNRDLRPAAVDQPSTFRNAAQLVQVNGVVHEYANGSFNAAAPTHPAPVLAVAADPTPAPTVAQQPPVRLPLPLTPVHLALPRAQPAINHNHHNHHNHTYTQANNSSYLHVTDSSSSSVYARRTSYSYATSDFPQPRADAATGAGARAAAPYHAAPAAQAMPAQRVAYHPAPAMPAQPAQPVAYRPAPAMPAFNPGPAGGAGYLPPDLLQNQPRIPALGEAGGSNYGALGAPAPIRTNTTFDPLADLDNDHNDAYRVDEVSSAGGSTPRRRGRPPRKSKDGEPEDYSAWIDHGAVPPLPIAQPGIPHKLNHVCFNCGYVGESTWRRSLRYLTKMVCNRCGCFEKEKGKDRHWHRIKDTFQYTHAAERRRRRDTGQVLPDGTPEPKWIRPVTAGRASGASASGSSVSPAGLSRSTQSPRASPLPTTPGTTGGPSTPGPVRHTRQHRSPSPYAAPPAQANATPGAKRGPGRPRKN